MNIGESKRYIHIDSQKSVHEWILHKLMTTIYKLNELISQSVALLKSKSREPSFLVSWGLAASDEDYQAATSNPFREDIIARLSALHDALRDAEDEQEIKSIVDNWSATNPQSLKAALLSADHHCPNQPLVSEVNRALSIIRHTSMQAPVPSWSRCDASTMITRLSYALNAEDAATHRPEPYVPPTYCPPPLSR